MDESADALPTDSPALAACYGGSVTRRTAPGAQAGKRVVELGADPNAPWVNVERPRHDHYRGFDLHADVAVAADDRQGLERLLRYGARPAISSQRLSLQPDGRIALALKRRYHDGTRALVFEPTALIERLASLVPHRALAVRCAHPAAAQEPCPVQRSACTQCKAAQPGCFVWQGAAAFTR